MGSQGLAQVHASHNAAPTMSKLSRVFRLVSPARLRTLLFALWKLFKHPQTPRAPKLLAIAVLAYAVSPIDLIPDFIPVLGLLDDLILIPLGVALVVRLTPKPLWAACVNQAEASKDKLPRLWWGAAAVILVWAGLLGLATWWLVRVVAAA